MHNLILTADQHNELISLVNKVKSETLSNFENEACARLLEALRKATNLPEVRTPALSPSPTCTRCHRKESNAPRNYTMTGGCVFCGEPRPMLDLIPKLHEAANVKPKPAFGIGDKIKQAHWEDRESNWYTVLSFKEDKVTIDAPGYGIDTYPIDLPNGAWQVRRGVPAFEAVK